MRENQQRRLRRKHLYGDISTNQVKSLLPRPVLSPPHHNIERASGTCCLGRKELKRKKDNHKSSAESSQLEQTQTSGEERL